MRLALHIFRKDVRYLYREIGLTVALTALVSQAEWLVAAAYVYLIARAIHAETIPGDRQFWLTRPYPWQSLLGAKLLFIVAFINVPLGVAQLAFVIAGGFPLAYELPGLLWSQLLIFLSCLVTMAVAAITVGLVPFILCGLTVLTAFLLKEFAAPLGSVLQLAMPSARRMFIWPSGVEWISHALVAVILTFAAVWVIVLQYRRRQTGQSTVLALAASILTTLVLVGLPVRWALNAQTLFSRHPSVTANMQSSVGELRRSSQWAKLRPGVVPGGDAVPFELPLILTGLPAGIHVTADRLMVSLTWPGRPDWQSDSVGVSSRKEGVFDGTLVLPADVYRANADIPLTLRASLFVTLFRDAESQVIPLQLEPATGPAGLRCRRVDFPRPASDPSLPPSGLEVTRNLVCESFFRWPARLVYANTGSADMDFTNLISYSPFPATLSLWPIEAHTADLSPSASVAMIIAREPIAHVRRDFELRDVRLGDFDNLRPHLIGQ
jgi:hypothetical protein